MSAHIPRPLATVSGPLPTRCFCFPGRRMASGRPVRSWCGWAWTRHRRTVWPLTGSARSCPHAQPACARLRWQPSCGASRRTRARSGCAPPSGWTVLSTRSIPSEPAFGASDRPDSTGTRFCTVGWWRWTTELRFFVE